MDGTCASTKIGMPPGQDALAAAAPFQLSYAGVRPNFASPPIAASDAAVLGRATLGLNARLGAASVIRADGHFVRAGDDFALGPRSTVHIAHAIHPAIIGDRVAVGANAVVHACTLGNDIVVGDGAVILDGSVVADNVVVEPRSIVFPRSELAGGNLYAGMPARPVRDLQPGELERRRAELVARVLDTPPPFSPDAGGDLSRAILVAATARLGGRIVAGEGSSVWFGCAFDANGGEVLIGENSNIQDNTTIRCRPGKRFSLGSNSTIGHNVTLGDCMIGMRSLIGIGSVVANGTTIGDDVLLAAGAETTEGQVLEGGFLWGRRPAVKMAPLDAEKRRMIARTIEHYRAYARAFADAQRD